jgi:hypothetical protein
METDEIELDLPPEYCHYRDEGCEISSSCLNCPLPRCIYDQPGGRRRWLKKHRNYQIIKSASTRGLGVKELAAEYNLSQRTIQRVLNKAHVCTEGAFQYRGNTLREEYGVYLR